MSSPDDRQTGDSASSSKKRPVGVWVTSVFIGFSTLLIPLMVLVSVPPDIVALMLERAGPLEFVNLAGNAAITVANLLGAIFLFRLRRVAAQLFGWVLALGVGLTIIELLTTDPGSFEPASFVFSVLWLSVGAAIYLYARRLRTRGVLE